MKVPMSINKNFRTRPQPLLPQDNRHPWGLVSVLVAEEEHLEGFGGCPVIFQKRTQSAGPASNRDNTSCPFCPMSRGSSKKERGLEIRRVTLSSIRKKMVPH